MIIQHTLGKISDFPEKSVDYVDVEWYNSHKKIDRLSTRSGKEIGIRLDNEAATHGLRQDDVLVDGETTLIAVNILPCDCLVVHITDSHQLPKFCYEIGNRHAPFFYGESHHHFVTPFEKPIQVMLEKLGLEVSVESVKINLDHAISASNGGGHHH